MGERKVGRPKGSTGVHVTLDFSTQDFNRLYIAAWQVEGVNLNVFVVKLLERWYEGLPDKQKGRIDGDLREAFEDRRRMLIGVLSKPEEERSEYDWGLIGTLEAWLHRDRLCPECGGVFAPTRKDKRFCCDQHRKTFGNRVRLRRSERRGGNKLEKRLDKVKKGLDIAL